MCFDNENTSNNYSEERYLNKIQPSCESFHSLSDVKVSKRCNDAFHIGGDKTTLLSI